MTGRESPLARARAAALAELRAAPRAVPWRRHAIVLGAAQTVLALAGIGFALAAGLAPAGDVAAHLVTIGALLAMSWVGAMAALAPRQGGAGLTWRVAALASAPAVMALLVLARGAGSPPASPEWVCTVSHLGVGLLPLGFVLAGLRQSARSWTGALGAGLGAGTLGALLGELVCHQGARHVLVYHLGAWVLLALGCLALSRWLRPRTFAP